ncbi:MAG: energy-coupling factor transporter transmembrane protein EcfT [Clostridiales bacterium]|nr:energy-coupling factor transporter transmembrane protein EcfT [Clostridiales bacterium]
MLKDITVGQYYPADSPMHRLNPRVKLLASLAFLAAVFIISGVWGYALAVAMTAAVIAASRVPVPYLFRGLRSILFMLLFTVALNVFFTPGDDVVFSLWGLRATASGVAVAARTCVRLTLIIVGSSLLTLTTTSIELTDAIEFSLKPFRPVGVPAHEIAMMMTIALRFIPTLTEELDKIMKAQAARGADFDTGGLIRKAKSFVPVLVPLFVSAFRRADELATAMEARCYRGGVGRTRMRPSRLYRRDYIAIVLAAFAFTAMIAAGRIG